jgi:hypothetical protein
VQQNEVKVRAFWDTAPCSLGADRRFRGAYCFNETTRRYLSEGSHLYIRHRENLKSHKTKSISWKIQWPPLYVKVWLGGWVCRSVVRCAVSNIFLPLVKPQSLRPSLFWQRHCPRVTIRSPTINLIMHDTSLTYVTFLSWISLLTFG